MATFRYEATDRAGVFRSGTVVAGTIRQATEELVARGLYVRRVEPLATAIVEDVVGTEEGDEPLEVTTFLPPLSEEGAERVAGLLVESVGSGLPLEPALRAAAEDAGRRERRVLRRVANDIAAGLPPAEAFARAGEALPSHLLALILAGLEGGDLARLLGRYLTLSRQRSETRRLAWLGLAYPLVLLCGAGVALAVVMAVIVPQFKKIFDDFGSRLPWMTQALFDVAWFANTSWGPVLAVATFFGLMFLLYWILVRRRGVRLSALPVLDFFIRSSEWGRFCGLLGLLVEGRQSLPQALRLTAASATTVRAKTAGLMMADDIEHGLTPWEAALPRRMPAAVRHVFRWAHRPEVFTEALAGLAELYSRRSRVTAAMIGLFLEPLVLFLVAGSIGFVVVALFLPLFQLLNDLS
jgi:type II secretory pathway component PulF